MMRAQEAAFMEEERNFARQSTDNNNQATNDSVDMGGANFAPTQIGPSSDAGPIRESFA